MSTGQKLLGIDLAAEGRRTGVARLEWDKTSGTVRTIEVSLGHSDEELVRLMSASDKSGIDCPLGWPSPFIEFITQHREGAVDVPAGEAADWRRQRSYRTTDLRVKELGLQGLSVSTDRIGVTSMRCAALLSKASISGIVVDRAGVGPIVEIYPAASLLRWGIPHRGYKQAKGQALRDQVVSGLQQAAPWLDLGEHEELCRRKDDALDAVICALTALLYERGLVEPIPEDCLEIASVEGWIALPTGHLPSSLA